MVGVPRSTGCSRCIKRRIKCDEGKPDCANCLKYGTDCPGYDKGLKFIVGKPHRTRRPRSKTSPDSKNGSSPDMESPAPFKTIPYSASKTASPTLHSQKSGTSSFAVVPVVPDARPRVTSRASAPEAYTSPFGEPQRTATLEDLLVSIPTPLNLRGHYSLQLITSLCQKLPAADNKNEILIMSNWLRQLPGRFGNSKTLDAAIASFTTQQMGTSFNDRVMLQASRDAYVQALALLQRSLNNPVESKSSDTTSAAFLLCIYELFAGTTSHDSWKKHAAGLSRLVQYRGPEGYTSAFDQSLLRACRGLIVMECLFSGKPVFLLEPKWQKVARTYLEPNVDEDFFNFFEDFNQLLGEIPEIVMSVWGIREAQKKGKPVYTQEFEVVRLSSMALDCYGRWLLWYEELKKRVPYPVERPNPNPENIFPTMYHFNGTAAAGLYSTYWACTIMLQEMLVALGCNTENHTDSKELANMICKSVEYLSEGTWSGFKLGFVLRIAFEMVDPEVKRWIGEWHVKQSRSYAATSIHALPDDAALRELQQMKVDHPGQMEILAAL